MTNNNKLEQRADIVGALARAYCSKENEQKVLDPELIEAMVPEIETLIEQTRKEEQNKIVKMVKELGCRQFAVHDDETGKKIQSIFLQGHQECKDNIINNIKSDE